MNQFTYELFLNVFFTLFADDYLYNILNYPITRKSAFCDYADQHYWDMYMKILEIEEEVNIFSLSV